MIASLATIVLTKKFVGGSVLALGLVAMTVDPTAFATAAAFIIGAIGGAAVLVINAIGKMKTDVLKEQALLDAKVDIVKGHVDGMTTAAAAKRTADENTILALKQQLADAERRATLLAQSVASHPSGPPIVDIKEG